MDEDSISFGRMSDRNDGPTLRDVFDASYRGSWCSCTA